MFLRCSRTAWALSFACLSMFVLGLSDNVRGPLFPELLRAFDLSNTAGSFSFALASFAALIGNAAAAVILRRIHLDRLLAWSVAFMSGGVFLMGLAPAFGWYLLGCFLFGLGMGSTGVAQNLLIAENVQGPAQTRSLSVLHGLYGFSSLLAPLVASRSPGWFAARLPPQNLLAQWPSAFFMTAVSGAVVLGLILVFSPDQPFVHHEASGTGAARKSPVTTMLWFAGFFATYVASEIMVSSRLALYMRSYFGAGLQESSNYVTGFFVCLLAGRLLFALKTFPWPIRKQLSLSLGLSVLLLGLGLASSPLFLVLCGLTMAPFYPLAIVYISEQAGVQKRRFITFCMGLQSVCVILMHMGVGYLTDIFGLLFAFGVGIVLLLVALLCLNFHPEVRA